MAIRVGGPENISQVACRLPAHECVAIPTYLRGTASSRSAVTTEPLPDNSIRSWFRDACGAGDRHGYGVIQDVESRTGGAVGRHPFLRHLTHNEAPLRTATASTARRAPRRAFGHEGIGQPEKRRDVLLNALSKGAAGRALDSAPQADGQGAGT